MHRKPKKPLSYFRFDAELAQKLDRRIARVGYASRSDFFTAVAYVALYGEETKNRTQEAGDSQIVENLPETVTQWVVETMPSISEEEIQEGLSSVIEEMLTPVIAMKGVEVAYENTWEDVREAFHSRVGVWVTESDVREAFLAFAAIHRGELEEYREKQLRSGV